MTLERVWMPSPCYSSRGGANVRIVVIHTAEGARTIDSLGAFFANPANQVSSQTGADDQPGRIGEYVKRSNKSWTQAEFNPVATSIELCGFAAWTRSEWTSQHANMLENCRQWIREECAYFNLPVVRLTPQQAQNGGRGVCAHSDLGARGGGHTDPGPGFPWDVVLGGATDPPSSTVGGEMIASGNNNGGTPHVWWVGANKRQVYYRWKDDGEWKGGHLFAQLAQDVAGLSCVLDEGGNLNVFARLADGNVRYTWQPKHKNDWQGKGDTPAAFQTFP